jgi:hypothetical protein
MSPVGYFETWPIVGAWNSGYDTGLVYAVNSTSGFWCTIYAGPDRNIDWNMNIIPVRLKYTGDD